MTDPQTVARTALLAGHEVNRIGYGAMQLEHAERDAAITLLRKAVELGVQHVDTAAFYGHGTVNALLHDALAPYRADVVIVTKIGAERVTDGLVPAQRPEQLRRSVEANLAQLGLQQLPVVNLRRADREPGIVATGDQVVDLDSQLAELVAMRDEGLIGAIGLSQVDADQLRSALPAGIVCVQNRYNLLEREDEPVLSLCEQERIAYLPYFPLGSGFAHLPSVRANAEVVAAAGRLGVTPSQVGLAWLLARSPQVLLIPGTRDEGHLAENLAAADVHLDAATRESLDRPGAQSIGR